MYAEIGEFRHQQVKRAFSTRNVPDEALRLLRKPEGAPSAGDLVLARVVEVGHHKQVELVGSRKATLFPGDEIVLAFGNRYAPDQFEAVVPDDFGICEMVAAGGIAGRVVVSNARVSAATRIEPVGVFVHVDNGVGRIANVADFALKSSAPTFGVPAIAVTGGSMNAGKTTCAANIVHGFTRAGFRVGAAKLTGTGAGNDFWHMKDAGAVAVYDFTDAGLATTYRASPSQLEQCVRTLSSALVERGADVLVFEIADGIFQQETRWLIGSDVLRGIVSAYVYAGESAASAAIGVERLRGEGHFVLCSSGRMTLSPLAMREAEEATGLPCHDVATLSDPATATHWFGLLTSAQAVA